MFCVSFWSKLKARGGAKSKNKHPSCGRTVRSSHWRYSIKMLLLKILQYPHETPVLESLFKLFFSRSEGLQLYSNVNILKLKRLPISKNIECFFTVNGSLLHGHKVSRSRIYEGISQHISSWTCVWKRKTNAFAESIKLLYWLFLVVLDCPSPY